LCLQQQFEYEENAMRSLRDDSDTDDDDGESFHDDGDSSEEEVENKQKGGGEMEWDNSTLSI
jgi:hypothetical protein